MSRQRRALPAPALDIPQDAAAPDDREAHDGAPMLTSITGGAFGLLQSLIARVDTMVYATQQHFERFGWRCRDEVDETENPIGHLAHLIGAAREASLSAVSAASVIAEELAKRGGVA